MGIVSRFERRLQGAVGDGFARVFGGHVVPQEVEAALQQAATDRVQELDGGHLLAPNSYVITINETDHEQLTADHDMTVHAFEKHLADYIHDQGWQTYGDIRVDFQASPTLHTGQFRTSGTVDPDVGRRQSPARSEPPADPPQPEKPHPQPGAGSTMTQNPGHDPSRDPAEDDRGEARSEGGRLPRLPQRRGTERADYRNGAYPPADPAGAPHQNGYPAAGEPRYSGQNGYDRGYGADDAQPRDRGYPAEPQYDPAPYADQYGGYADRRPDDRRAPAYDDGRAAPGAEAYASSGYPEPEYAEPGYQPPGQSGYPPRYPAPYQQPAPRGYDPAYGAAGRPGGGYGQPGDYDPGYGGRTGYTATLQLDDGSGRTYQLREGSNIVGRGQDAHFRLPDTGVSRRHIEVRWDGRTAMLSDLGSTNGTLVNGAPVQDWQLADGDVIRAGHSEILIRIV